jgi:hypothetical protein
MEWLAVEKWQYRCAKLGPITSPGRNPPFNTKALLTRDINKNKFRTL